MNDENEDKLQNKMLDLRSIFDAVSDYHLRNNIHMDS